MAFPFAFWKQDSAGPAYTIEGGGISDVDGNLYSTPTYNRDTNQLLSVGLAVISSGELFYTVKTSGDYYDGEVGCDLADGIGTPIISVGTWTVVDMFEVAGELFTVLQAPVSVIAATPGDTWSWKCWVPGDVAQGSATVSSPFSVQDPL